MIMNPNFSRAQKALKNDRLFQTIRAGTANKDDMRSAAEMILWMARYVPDESLELKRIGGSALNESEREEFLTP